MLIPILLLYLSTYVRGKVCGKDQFYSEFLQECTDCSRCIHPEVTISPCTGTRNVQCGSPSELNIEWSGLRGSDDNEKPSSAERRMVETFQEHINEITKHEKHVQEKKKHSQEMKRFPQESDEDDDYGLRSEEEVENEGSLWNKLKSYGRSPNQIHKSLEDKVSDDLMALEKQNRLEEPRKDIKGFMRMPFDLHSDRTRFSDEEVAELLKSSPKEVKKEFNKTYDENNLQFDENGLLIKNFGFQKAEEPFVNVKVEKLMDNSKYASNKLSSTEKFILDWQTVILGVAVSSCLIFFLVAAVYSIQYAKHWKKLRHYFNTADAEELQSWIASKNTKRKLPMSGVYKTTTEVVHKEGGQCKYLERIINMNGKNKLNRAPSNIYEVEKQSLETKPLTGVHKHQGNQI